MIVTLARKPFGGSAIDNIKSVHCGAINVDSCRIPFENDGTRKETKRTPRDDDAVWSDKNSGMKKENSRYADADPKGRFPSNVLLSKNASKILDQQSGIATNTSHYSYKRDGGDFIGGIPSQENKAHWRTETGGASRYFKEVGNEES